MRWTERAVPVVAVTLAAALTLSPSAARSESTAGCHCFRDRSFEPERPGAADPYILATTRSSLLSAAFGVPKADLVRAVMTGAAPEDLWVAHWAGARLKRQGSGLLEARAERGSWKAALAGADTLGSTFDAALARGAPPAELAALAVDDVLVGRARASPAAIRAIRAAGASTEETVVATVLSSKLGAPVLPLVVEVRAGRTTWGRVLHEAGIDPGQLDGLVRGLVAGRP